MTATGAAGVVTPLTTLDHDIFGNVVHTVRFGKGAAVANETDYTVVGPDGANDQQRYSLFDKLGREVQAFDAEGAASFYSYDALGHVAKRWQAITDNAGVQRNAITLFEYDRLGPRRGVWRSRKPPTAPSGKSIGRAMPRMR
jgi:YD repeat-containing protein